MKFLQSLDRFEEIVASAILAVMSIVIGLQVFSRYVLEDSLVWSEELSRYLLIWIVYIGCSYAAKENRHLEVTFVRSMLGRGAQRVMIAFSYLITLVFCGFCIVWGIEMLQFLALTGQKTQSLGISVFWVYLALPCGMALMALRMLQRFWLVAVKGQLPNVNPVDLSP